MQEVERLTRELYDAMPGAPQVPKEHDPRAPHNYGARLWGEVEGNYHWQFCNRIAAAIIRNNVSTFVEPD